MTSCLRGCFVTLLICFLAHLSNANEATFNGVELFGSEFYGAGSDLSRYIVKADKSTQVNSSTHNLKGITGTYKEPNKESGFDLVANKGIYDSSQQILDLLKDVKVNFDAGYEVATEKLTINFGKHLIYTKNFVKITSNKEYISSESGFVDKVKDKTLYFYGPVTTILKK